VQRCSSFLLCAAAHRPLFHPLALRGTDTDTDTDSPSPSGQPQRFALDTHCGYAHVIRGGPAGALLCMHLQDYRPPRPVIRHLHCVFPLLPLPFACRLLQTATSHGNGKHVGFLVLLLPPPNHSAHAWATCHGASAHVWSPHFRDSGLCIYLSKATGL
jgi:hypothetical protein